VLSGNRTRFTVWAPIHERLRVLLEARHGGAERRAAMTRSEDGRHTVELEAPPGTRYWIEFEDGTTRPDPASLAQPDGVHGASMVVDLRDGGGVPRERGAAAAAPAPPFECAPIEQHVFYELHVGTFTPEGTFDAIIPRLPALRELGVTAIELMPIAQFPGERNWGYDGVDLFAAQWSYGGVAGLQRLVRAAHASSIAVLLDVVYNHLGPEGNSLAEFGPYFTDRYRTPWGAAINFDGAGSDGVREFFIENALHWTRDVGLDGLRLDAVHAIFDVTPTPFLEELTERVHAAGREQGRRVLVIAESSSNDPRVLRPASRGGLGMDGCWNDGHHHSIRAALTGDRRGYYVSYGEPALVARGVRDRFVYSGQYSPSRGRRHGRRADDIDHRRLIAFTQNHDQVGNRPLGERLDACAGADGARLTAALVLLSPFTPMLWMGEEYGETAPFQYFTSHGDPQLVEAVRRGRAREFEGFHEGGTVPDPQDEATFERSKLDWSTRESARGAARLAYYRELLRLRREIGLTAPTAPPVHARHDGALVSIDYESTDGGARFVLMANLGSSPLRVPSARAELLLDSNDRRWTDAARNDSAAPGAETKPIADPIIVAPRQAVLLRTPRAAR